MLQARLYDALGGASGLVLTVGTLFPLYAVLPLADRRGSRTLGPRRGAVAAAGGAGALLVPYRRSE